MKVHIKEIITEQDSKTLSIKTSKIHEIIIRYPIENKLANINVLFTKLGYAEITNLLILDGEKDNNKEETRYGPFNRNCHDKMIKFQEFTSK